MDIKNEFLSYVALKDFMREMFEDLEYEVEKYIPEFLECLRMADEKEMPKDYEAINVKSIDSKIELEMVVYWGCNEYDNRTYYMPIKFAYDKDFRNKYIEKHKAIKEEKGSEKRLAKIKREKMQKESRYEEFLKMKTEFKGEGDSE